MEKQSYFFIGSECQLGDLKLEKFGTEVKLDAAAALNALEGGAQLCPQKDFNFTEQEVSLYPYPAFRASAPEVFQVKFRAAMAAVVAHLEELKKGQSNE
jgi:hypothetical protein